MTYLSAAEVASLRGDVVTRILDMTCTIQRNTPGAADSHGKKAASWATLSAGVRCHYWEQNETEHVGQPNATTTVERIQLPANTDVTADDRINGVVGIDGTTIAGILDIIEVLKREFDVVLIVRAIR